MKIWESAKGRWPEIISAIVGEQYTNTRLNQPCPLGQGKDRYRFSDQNGRGSYFCACSDGSKGGIDLIRCVRGCGFQEAAELVEDIIGKSEWERRKPVAALHEVKVIQVAKSKYLESRGLEIPPGISFCRDLDYYDDEGNLVGVYPAMMGSIAREGRHRGWHATYLQDGRKADLSPNRKMIGKVNPDEKYVGGGVALYPAAETMGVGEGIESSIAAKMLSSIPTHAALNTALLAKWQWPDICKKLYIFADNDRNYAGQAAAYALAHRAAMKGLQVIIEMPEFPDTDWNDALISISTGKAENMSGNPLQAL